MDNSLSKIAKSVASDKEFQPSELDWFTFETKIRKTVHDLMNI
jgi:hypothetical protein